MTKTLSNNLPFDLPAAIEWQRQELLTKLRLQGVTPQERTSAADAVETDHHTWRQAVLPRWYRKPDGWFHREAWDKVWAVTDDALVAPRPLLLPWFRFAGKSATIRGGAVCLAARRRRRFFLYFSAVQESADKHVVNISRMLQTQEMARYYPDLAHPMLSQVTGSHVSWSRQQIVTRGGVVFVALGLDAAARGINWEEIRPDVIVIDDIDKLRDSVQVVQNKIEVLGSDIFPAGQENTWIVFAQNVIHGQSCMKRTIDGTSGILVDHDCIGPVPAVHNLNYEKRINPSSGKPRFYFMPGCRATWPEGFDLPVAEQHLNNSGPVRFQREYQHNTDILPAGALYPAYNPLVHLVTRSELAASFARYGVYFYDSQGQWRVPHHWSKAMGLDFGTTDEHPTAIKWVTTPPELEPYGPSDDRAGLVIWYRERTRPKYPRMPGEPQEPVSPLGLAKLIHEEERYAREADNMKLRVMSHEQSAAQGTFNFDFDEKIAEELPGEFKGLGFVKVRPDRRGGISTMQNFFEVDYSQPNQFRRYPKGYKLLNPNSGEMEDVSGQFIPGRVRMVFVVADGQGELYVDDTGALKVTSAIDDDGCIRSRAERMQYTEKVQVTGAVSRFPNDFFNDQMDAERNVPAKAIEAGILFVAAAPAAEDVRHEHEVAQIRPDLTSAAINARPAGAREGALVARMMLDRHLERQREERDRAGSAIGQMYDDRRR